MRIVQAQRAQQAYQTVHTAGSITHPMRILQAQRAQQAFQTVHTAGSITHPMRILQAQRRSKESTDSVVISFTLVARAV